MITYSSLQTDRRQFLTLTGLTLREFQLLLPAFRQSYECLYPSTYQTLAGRARQRAVGAGRRGALTGPEQKLLFLLVYLKTYPLQAVMAELFDLSQPGVNYWLHRLLPVLHDALGELGVLPERDPGHLARGRPRAAAPRLIIDGTERRRQRPKSPEKQALHYSGKKKAHTDKNLVLLDRDSQRLDFLSRTYAGTTHDKKMADQEQLAYPPGTELHKDTGFQGYEPAVRRTCQAKKKATRRRAHSR
jgi:hypothetical protein